jgi:hypothetical protein
LHLDREDMLIEQLWAPYSSAVQRFQNEQGPLFEDYGQSFWPYFENELRRLFVSSSDLSIFDLGSSSRTTAHEDVPLPPPTQISPDQVTRCHTPRQSHTSSIADISFGQSSSSTSLTDSNLFNTSFSSFSVPSTNFEFNTNVQSYPSSQTQDSSSYFHQIKESEESLPWSPLNSWKGGSMF